jgi:SAM-dependent methyltransferase
MTLTHNTQTPSEWVQRWTHLVQPESSVLDVACGHGRHMRWFSEQGHVVTGVDRSGEAGVDAAQWGEFCLADIESEPWPLRSSETGTNAPRQFDVVVVSNYLWRPLMPTVLQSVRPGGLLIYETFAVGNETVGKPSRPDFLLRRGELLECCQGMHIHAYEDLRLEGPARFVQRITATLPA